MAQDERAKIDPTDPGFDSRPDAEKARADRRRERHKVRIDTLTKNTVIESTEKFMSTRIPAGCYTQTEILKYKREGEQWKIIGVTSQRGAPGYYLYRPVQPAAPAGAAIDPQPIHYS